ncbi:MAG: hypothetical protein HQK91_14430 [Nitrospirae bacterium]|nr:hypothetical protein [Nitrospirota bacterium]MBF0542635.1 hypothetical protein [Nitrospirota bacterium]
MQCITTLEEVENKVKEMSQYYEDRLVPIKDITFDNIESVRIDSQSYKIRPIAQREIANRLNIPLQYIKRCTHEVQAYNLNHWIKKEANEKLFFRFDKDAIRAVFTPRYIPIDNIDILTTIHQIRYYKDTEVQYSMDDEFMVISILDDSDKFGLNNNDELRPGISISNSEVGIAGLSISAYLLRLVCTNGLIDKTNVTASYRHVSRKILNKFPEVIEKVSNGLDRQKSQLKLSLESKVNDPLATIKNFNKHFQLESPELNAVDWAWPLEAGDTMFNIVNTYTRAAQYSYLQAESCYKLQKVGGMVLESVN